MSLLAQTCCVPNTGPLTPGGALGDRVQMVYTVVFWASVALGGLVAILLVYAFFRFRRRADEDEPSQFHGNTRLEIGWTLLPLAVFLALFVLTAINMPFVNDIAANTQMRVTVIGVQFNWTFDYGTTANGNRVQSNGVLFLPENTEVGLDIVSTDPPCNAKPVPAPGQSFADALTKEGCGVNHSLYLASLNQQMNALPGQTNHAPIDARQGTYYGQCTELCGTGHAQMTFEVVALPNNQFQSCVFGDPKGAVDPTNPACKPGGS